MPVRQVISVTVNHRFHHDPSSYRHSRAGARPTAIGNAAPGPLKNGNFADNIEHWDFHYAQEYRDKIKPPRWIPPANNQPAAVVIEVPHASSSPYVRLEQELSLQSGKTYRLHYETRGTVTEGRFRAVYGQKPANASWKNLGLGRWHELTDNWQTYEITFTVGEIETASAPLLIFCYGEFVGRCDLRNVSLTGPIEPTGAIHRAGNLVTGKAAPTAAPAAAPTLRTWTDKQGRTLEATLLRVENDVAILERPDKKTLRVSVSKLSDADQQYLRAPK